MAHKAKPTHPSKQRFTGMRFAAHGYVKLGQFLGVLLLGVGLNGAPVWADYPERTIRIVVTFPPGGGTDLLAPKLGVALQQELGQAVVIENRPGASGNICARVVAQAQADGYTLLMANSSFAINPGVYRHLSFFPERDFAAVIAVATVPSMLVVAADSSLKTFQDLIEASVRARNPLSFASCGNGTPQHLAGKMLRSTATLVLMHVPYRGCGPALTDVMVGQLDVGIVTASGAMPYVESGRLRALAVTSAQRWTPMPAIPTVAEQCFKGYELDQWHNLLAPAGTPDAVLQRLNTVLGRIVGRAAMRRELSSLGFNPIVTTQVEFQRLLLADIERFAALTAGLGLQAD
jgi:tripartite-type tricarboxylate transporter receptor subunit TctC